MLCELEDRTPVHCTLFSLLLIHVNNCSWLFVVSATKYQNDSKHQAEPPGGKIPGSGPDTINDEEILCRKRLTLLEEGPACPPPITWA